MFPGLIDMHVHLRTPGGVYRNESDYAKKDAWTARVGRLFL